MSNVIALIPARAGSKGIPGKNWKMLGGKSLIHRAAECAHAAGIKRVVLTTDLNSGACGIAYETGECQILNRPAALASDDTPMYDVVKHAVETLQLAEDDIVVLLQPTQPFRKPEHITHAVQMLRETQAHCVVSAVPLPLTHHGEFQIFLGDDGAAVCRQGLWFERPTRRQEVSQPYKCDGTVYAFWAKTIRESASIFGFDVKAFKLDPSESCEMDTEADWEAVTARWSAQHG